MANNATFMIPGDVLQSVGILGGSAPETGYYRATVDSIEEHPTKVQSRRVNLNIEGFTTSDWLTIPYAKNGEILAKYADRDDKGNAVLNKSGRGCVAAFKTMLFSAGYTDDQMGQGASDAWLVGKTVYLEWHAGADIGAQYGEVVGYLTPKAFEVKQASGAKPAVAGAGQAVAGGNANIAATAPTTVSVAPTPSSLPTPPNGVAAPSAGNALPPAPSAASVVN